MIISLFIIFIYHFIPVSSDLWCDNPYQCANQTINEWDQRVYITAYKGALATSASVYDMYCSGSFSCQSMIIHGYGDVVCYGTHSCSNTTIILYYRFDSIYCNGANACMFSVLISRDYVDLYCDGYFSCAHSHIDSITTVYANGAYALYKATIDINNNSNPITTHYDVYLTGDYAGYGGTIICREQFECHIFCRSYTSCYMLFIDCIGECIVFNETQHTILPITDIDIQTVSNDVGDINIALNNDEDCNTASMSILWDSVSATDANNDSDIIITRDNEGPICCRGKESCSYIDRIEYESATKENIICSGWDACYESRIISNNGAVFCEGNDACEQAYIFNASVIYFSGSSRRSMITRSHRIRCNADYACDAAKIISGGSDLSVYFGGAQSGSEAVIYCNATDLCDIICGGWHSCIATHLICDGNCTIQCNEESFCPIGWTASPTAVPTEFTPNPTQYPTLTLTQTSYYPSTSSTPSTSKLSIYIESDEPPAPKKPNKTLIIIVISSISLILIGCIIWYLMKRRKKKQIFAIEKTAVDMQKHNKKRIELIQDKRDNKDDDNITQSDDNKDDEPDLLDDIKGEADEDDSIEKMYYDETTDYNMSQSHDEKDDKTDLLHEIEGIHKTEEAQIDNGVNEENKLYAELIRKWLKNMRLEQYLSLFIENGYDSLDYISEITNKNELMDIGIHLKGHQTKIMAQIKQLKRDHLQSEGNVISDNKWKQVLVDDTAIKNTDDHDDIYVKEKSENVNKQQKHDDYTDRSKEKQTLDYYDKHLIKPHIDNENTHDEAQTKTI